MDDLRHTDSLSFTVAELTWQISLDAPLNDVRPDATYTRFPPRGEPIFRLAAQYGSLPLSLLDEALPVFNSGAVWSLVRRGSDLIFVQRTADEQASIYAMAVIHDDLSAGDLYLAVPETSQGPGALLPSPLVYPLTEILMVCLLARGHGVMVHACGVDDGGRGYMFSGQSGAGKSTLARLWTKRGRVLNDDRIVLRLRDGQIWMYGTPWHGTFDAVAPDGVPLERGFFISHAAENSVGRCSPEKAVAALMARSFLPFWDANGVAFSLGFFGDLTSSVRFFDLGVVPTPDIIDVIRCAT